MRHRATQQLRGVGGLLRVISDRRANTRRQRPPNSVMREPGSGQDLLPVCPVIGAAGPPFFLSVGCSVDASRSPYLVVVLQIVPTSDCFTGFWVPSTRFFFLQPVQLWVPLFPQANGPPGLVPPFRQVGNIPGPFHRQPSAVFFPGKLGPPHEEDRPTIKKQHLQQSPRCLKISTAIWALSESSGRKTPSRVSGFWEGHPCLRAGGSPTGRSVQPATRQHNFLRKCCNHRC
jgi:hypothetical protein